jgi:hypothetical protein
MIQSKLVNTFTSALLLSLFLVANAYAAGKTYTEDEFLNNFSGKSKKVIVDKLGAPAKKQLSVKPTNASTMLAGKVKEESTSKPVKVEMWYYKNLVKYDPKRTYKETEITFVNDRVNGIAFFNNR